MELRAGMLLPLTPLHTLDVTRAEGEYLILAFDSNFYCIFGHDGEVSCSGEYGFPLLSGAGRLVIKDTAILAGVVVLLSDTARKLLARRREA